MSTCQFCGETAIAMLERRSDKKLIPVRKVCRQMAGGVLLYRVMDEIPKEKTGA